MNLQRLNEIISKGEGQHTEFKEVLPDQAHKIAAKMVSFANSGGGFLLIGVTDDCTPIGVDQPVKIDERLSGIARGCDPPLNLQIERIDIRPNITVVCARIPHFPLCSYKGRVYVRDNTSSEQATSGEIEAICNTVNPRECVQLKYQSEEIQRISKKELKRKARYGYLIFGIGILIYIGIGILPLFIGLSTIISILYPLAIVLILACTFYLVEPYLRAVHLYRKRPRSSDTSIFVGKGRFMQDSGGAAFFLYQPTAACIYSHCDEGEITVVNAPPRDVERLGKNYIGICSVGGKDHSYYIDNILVATKEKFDWRPLDRTQ